MSDELEKALVSARKYDGAALAAILEAFAPRVSRLAAGLCGQARVAQKVSRIVMRQAMDAVPKLRDGDAVERWFNHRTVLESRQHGGGSREDALVVASPRRDPPWFAFVRAFRSLPHQQCEAFLLTHGERLNGRYVGVAMDCSLEAAGNHLRAATEDLKIIAAGEYESLLEALVAAYRALAPPIEVSRREIRRRVSRFLLPRRLKRVLTLLILAAIAFAVWHWRVTLRSMLPW